MNKLLKVTLEFDDKTMTIEGNEALRWEEMCNSLSILAQAHGMNPFDESPIKWRERKTS